MYVFAPYRALKIHLTIRSFRKCGFFLLHVLVYPSIHSAPNMNIGLHTDIVAGTKDHPTQILSKSLMGLHEKFTINPVPLHT